MSENLKVSRDTTLTELISNGCTIGKLVDILKKEMLKVPVLEVSESDEIKPDVHTLDGAEKEQNLKLRVTDICHEIGIPAHLKGYQYVREAIIQAYKKPDMLNAITKELYPEVAKVYNTMPSKVERGIRDAIRIAWDRGDLDVLSKFFGYTVSPLKGKPTNGEFIAMIVDYLHLQD